MTVQALEVGSRRAHSGSLKPASQVLRMASKASDFLFIEQNTQAALYNTVASLGRKVTALNRVATDQELRSSCPGTRPLGGDSASRTCVPETSCAVGRQPLPWDYFRFARHPLRKQTRRSSAVPLGSGR